MSMIAFYNGASGMRAFQNALDVTSHNIANVQTNGYKLQRPVFQDLLYSRINTNVEGEHLVGHGVKQQYIDQIMGQAGLNQSMHPLDFALVGDGFFQVDNNGTIEYTRNGAFDLSIEEAGPTLVTNDGAYVLDRDGNRIVLPEDAAGNVVTDGLVDVLGVHTFPNQWGLIPQDKSRFIVSENSGEAQLVIPGAVANGASVELLQGALELSGTDLGNEMVNMIMYQRGFQVSSRVLQTADEIANELNNLR